MNDTQAGESLDDFRGEHCRAVVAQCRTWKASLLERLRKTVRDVVRVLGEVPLQVAGQARAVIENTEQHRRRPLAAGGEDLARSEVTVPVPQTANILGFVTAHLAVFKSRLGPHRAGRVARTQASPLPQRLRLAE